MDFFQFMNDKFAKNKIISIVTYHLLFGKTRGINHLISPGPRNPTEQRINLKLFICFDVNFCTVLQPLKIISLTSDQLNLTSSWGKKQRISEHNDMNISKLYRNDPKFSDRQV